ncbi:MAG: guanylate kinase [Anaerolineales bacterium]|nr:MAG: guanylate kinase [Anaerolineales bacterium]
MTKGRRRAVRPALLVVISGPAGVGKDALIRRLKERGYPFHFVVTATDRAPRPGEEQGKDYFFLTAGQFDTLIERDELLEHAVVYNQRKGIPKQQIRDALATGKDVILRIDVQGAATVRRLLPDALLIFLSAGSIHELEERLRQRGTDSPSQIEMRIATAHREMSQLSRFDYVVINNEGQLDRAADHVMSILRLEHSRKTPRVVEL